jgi:hypothetical protein
MYSIKITVKKLYFCPHSVFTRICVVTLSQYGATTCLDSMNRQVFLTDVTEFSARYEFNLYVI